MNAFDDINQKIIIVVVFTAALLLVWIFVKQRFSEKIQIGFPGSESCGSDKHRKVPEDRAHLYL